MGFIIDLVIAIICILTVIKAYRVGLFRSIMNLARGIVSFLAAYAFTPMVADFIYKRWTLGWISGGIEKSIMSISKTEAGTYNLDKMFGDMHDSLKQIIDRYGANEGELGEMCRNVTDGTEERVSAISEYIAQPVADMISGAVAFLAIFALVFAVLSLVTFIIDGIFKLPVLKGANKLLGLLFGLAEAALFAILLSSAAAAGITGLGSVNPEIFGGQVIEGSVIMSYCSSVDLFGLLESVVG